MNKNHKNWFQYFQQLLNRENKKISFIDAGNANFRNKIKYVVEVKSEMSTPTVEK